MEGLTMVYIVKDLLYLPALYIREHKKRPFLIIYQNAGPLCAIASVTFNRRTASL
jgi:hypothetical protein